MEEPQEGIGSEEKSSTDSSTTTSTSTSEESSSTSSATTSSRNGSAGIVEDHEAPTSPVSTINSKESQGTSAQQDMWSDVGSPVIPPYVLSNDNMCNEFLDDQGKEDNFTDLDIICADGYIQAHRCLLMGASEFLCDLLIGRDILDTCAISVPDASVRHVKQALNLLYTGRTLIDQSDECPVLDVMNMLGFPVKDFLYRNAKESDILQRTELRHISMQQDENDAQDSLTSRDIDEDLTEKQSEYMVDSTDTKAVPFQNLQMSEAQGPVYDQCHEQLHNTETLNFHRVPNASLESLCGKSGECLLCGFQISVEESQQTLFDHVSQCKLKNGSLTKDVKMEIAVSLDASSYPPDLRDMTKVETLQINDLSFEEACEDLEKQMEQQQIANKQNLGKKRKMNDSPNSNQSIETTLGAEKSTTKTGSKAKKKKTSTPTEPRRVLTRNRTPNAKSCAPSVTTNHENQNVAPDESQACTSKFQGDAPENDCDSSKGKSEEVPGDESSQIGRSEVEVKESNGRVSTASSQSDDGSPDKRSSGSVHSNRVFLEVKEISGVKYNIYGFLDPNKGIQSGKTIAIMVENDDSF